MYKLFVFVQRHTIALSCTHDLICEAQGLLGKFPILGALGFRLDYAKILKMLPKPGFCNIYCCFVEMEVF